MDIRPIYNHVIAKKIVKESTSTFGIILTSSGTEDTGRAEILAVGTGSETDEGAHIPMSVQVGDIVAYIEGSETKVTFEGVDYIILKEEHITYIDENFKNE